MRILGIIACPLLLAAFVLPQAHDGNDGKAAEAAKAFVQGFYAWYVPVALRDNRVPAFDIALKQRPTAFGPILFRALKEDSEAQAKAQDLVGIDFDPFLNSQDPCHGYEVGTATPQKAGYRVEIYSVCAGKRSKKPDVITEIERRNGSWAFTNFLYPNIHSDLLSTLRSLREDRQKSSH